jgi:hypothetical protein
MTKAGDAISCYDVRDIDVIQMHAQPCEGAPFGRRGIARPSSQN